MTLETPPKALGRAAHRGSIFGAVIFLGALVLSVWQLSVLGDQVAEKKSELERQEKKVEAAKRELVDKVGELEARNLEIARAEDTLRDLRGQIAKADDELKRFRTTVQQYEKQNDLFSDKAKQIQQQLKERAPDLISTALLSTVIKVYAAVEQLGEESYRFYVWLDVPAHRRGEIKRVEYAFLHPTLERANPFVPEEGDPKYSVAYRGWGAVDRVLITLHLSQEGINKRRAAGGEGEVDQIPFNMYQELRRAYMSPDGPSQRMNPLDTRSAERLKVPRKFNPAKYLPPKK